jgi:hypothetical protein
MITKNQDLLIKPNFIFAIWNQYYTFEGNLHV